MGNFKITGPDGKSYKIAGETAEGAMEALKKHLSATGGTGGPQGVAEGEAFGAQDLGIPAPPDALADAMGATQAATPATSPEEGYGPVPGMVAPVKTVPTAMRLDVNSAPQDGVPLIDDPLMGAMTEGTPAAPAAPAAPADSRLAAITQKLADPNLTPDTRASLEAQLRGIMKRPQEAVVTPRPAPIPDGTPGNPEGTALGRALERGWISLTMTPDALALRNAESALKETTEGYGASSGYLKEAETLEESANAYEAELPAMEAADPEQAAVLREEIATMRAKAKIARAGAESSFATKRQRKNEAALAEGMPAAAEAALSLREKSNLRSAIPFSPQGQAFADNMAKAPDGFWETLQLFGQDPVGGAAFIAETAAESGPTIGAAGATALVTRNPSLSALVLSGGGAAQEYGNAVDEFLSEKKVKLDTQEDAIALLKDRQLLEDANKRGMGRTLAIAAFELLGQGLAGKLATGVKGAVADTGVQMATGSGGEATARVATNQELSPREILIEGLAEGVTAPAEIAIAGAEERSAKAQGAGSTPPATPPTPAMPTDPTDPTEDPLATAMGMAPPTIPKPKVDAKASVTAELRNFATKTAGAGIPAGSPAASQMDSLIAKAERAGMTDDEINAALSGKPEPLKLTAEQRVEDNPKPEPKPEPTPTPKVEAKPDPAPAGDFEVMDEVETIDGEERPTGRKVRVNLNTGDAEVVEDSEIGGDAHASAGTGGAPASAAPEEGKQAAVDGSPSPSAEPSKPVDTAPDPEFVGDRPPPVRKFLTSEETLAIKTNPKAFQYKSNGDEEGVTDALRNIKTFDPNRAGQVVLFERKDGTLEVADGHQRTGLARRAAAAGQADVGGTAATVYREADGYTAEEVMGLAALKNIGEGSGSAVDAARVLRTRSESIADLGLPPNSALVRKAEGIRRLGDDAFGMVANGVASEEYGDVVGRNVTDKAMQADILAMLTREKPDNLAQAAMIARDAASTATTEEQTDMFGTLQVQKSLYVERAKVLDAAMKSQGILAKTFRNLVEREGVITSAGNQLDTKANAALVDEAGQVRQYLQSQANMKGAISDALTKAAEAVRSGTPVARAAEGFVRDVKSALQGPGTGSPAPADGRAGNEGRTEDQQAAVTPAPAPEAGDDLFGAMMGNTKPAADQKPTKNPDDDLFAAMGGTPAQTGKTPDQVRAEAEAKVKAAQSKKGTTTAQADAGPLFDDQQKLPTEVANDKKPFDPIEAGREILKPYSRPDDERYIPKGSIDLRNDPMVKTLAAKMAAAKTAEAREALADTFVLDEGRKAKKEFLIVLGANGEILAAMKGDKSNVSLYAEVWRAMEDGKAAYATHNHPNSGDFSGNDLLIVGMGVGRVVAMAHDTGRRHVASAVPGAIPKTTLLTDKPKPFLTASSELTMMRSAVYEAGYDQVKNSDPVGLPERMAVLHRGATSLILHRMGIIDYTGGTVAEIEAQGFNFEEIYGRTSSTFADRLGRAGFVVSERGDPAGNQAAGSDAAPAPPVSDRPDQVTQKPDAAPDDFDAAASSVLDDIFGAAPPKAPAPTPTVTQSSDRTYTAWVSAVPSPGKQSGWTIFNDTDISGSDAPFVLKTRDLDARPFKTEAAARQWAKDNPPASVQPRTDQEPIKKPAKRSDTDIGKDLGNLFNEDPAEFLSPMERAKAKAKKRPAQRDMFDLMDAAQPGERQVDLEDLIQDLKDRDRDLFGFGEDVISQEKYARAVPLFREALAGQDVTAQPVIDTIRAVALRFRASGLTRDGIERMLPYLKLYLQDVQAGKLTNPVEDGDVPGTNGSVEPDRGDAAAGDTVGQVDLPPAGGRPGEGGTGRGAAPDDAGGQRDAGNGVPDGRTPPVGTQGNPAVENGTRGKPGSAVDRDGAGGRDTREQRPAPDSRPAAHTQLYAVDTSNLAVTERQALQAEADKLTKREGVKLADEANVRQALPLLLPEQQDDVIKIEKRYAKPNGHGMLLTNGTGTGKTYSGGGVVKRFVQQGKDSILIVAPSQGILDHWAMALDDMGIPHTRLDGLKDMGQGVTLTTYANLGENETLADREWDLVVTDEAHKLSQNADGDSTGALKTLRAITNHPRGRQDAAKMRRRTEWAKAEAMPDGDAKTAAMNRLFDLMRKEAAAMGDKPRGKVLFLSATPFAYVKNTDYAEGYLFDYPADGNINGSRQDGRNLFMVENFGYRIRYHKLTRPDVGVDTGVFEREFHEKLKRDGVLSGRMLDIEPDYDRRFVLSEDKEGSQIDEILQFISDAARGKDQRAKDYQALRDSMKDTFNYLKQMQLLEAIKARKAIPDIEAHLKLGRKVVVFHDYNVGGGFNPFRPTIDGDKGIIPTAEAYAGYARLTTERPNVEKMNFTGFGPPVQALKSHFGDRAAVYNGTVPQKVRAKAKTDFQTDGSGLDVLIVQSAAGEAGISLHDTTGAHQRALVNLGMPVRPTTALQEEGRTRREGSVTDAPFRYYTIGTAWERRAFAKKIAERSGTVENLALGNTARTIRDSFIDAYGEAEPIKPAPGDGKGGKERDRAQASASPYDVAKTHYYGRMKTTGRRDQREGLDFYPTAEPIAFKMVEWAGIRAYESVLEPSAGDGAIARYLPEHARRTIVEPSTDLLSRAELRAPGSRGVNRDFEDYHIANKHHAIVMNPPFGAGGKTAMDHLAKAMTHLKPGGRIVALVPTGPAADKRFEALWGSEAAKGMTLRAVVNLPAVAFEKAGTAVMSRVLVIDNVDAIKNDLLGQAKRVNLTGADTIAQLFDRMEDISLPDRVQQLIDPTEELETEDHVDEDGNVTSAPAMVIPPPAKITKPIADSLGGFKLAKTKHSKTGADLFVATAENRVDNDGYRAALAVAKQHGGWYSSFRGNGAIPGFQFKSEAQRQAFLDDMAKPTIGLNEDPAPFTTRVERDEDDEGVMVEALSGSRVDAAGEPLVIGHLHIPDEAIKADGSWSIGDIQVSKAERRKGVALAMVKAASDQIGGRPTGATSVFSEDGKAFFEAMQSGERTTRFQRPQLPDVDDVALAVDAQMATKNMLAIMPKLKKELARLNLSRVKIYFDPMAEWQGKIEIDNPNDHMAIFIGATNAPLATLYHEVIHALYWSNLFTPEEWTALKRAAMKGRWLQKYDINRRYPDLSYEERLEEAIAEEFGEVYARRQPIPKNSAVITAFNKIVRFFKAMLTAQKKAGFQTADDVFGKVLSGEIGARQNKGQRGSMARQQKARMPGKQARAHMATPMGGQHLHIPDRAIWQELSRAGAPIWQRLAGGAAAARDAVDRARVVIQDRMLPIRRAQAEIEKRRGSPLPANMDPYTVETTFSGKVGRHLFEIDEDFTKPIVTLIARTNGRLSAENVGTWLYARHAIERNARIASINPRMPDGGSGMTNADAQQILADAAASPDAAVLDQIGVYIDLLRERSLLLRQSKGLITAAEANRWRTQYKHYVPLKGWADTDQSDAMLDVSGVGRRYSTRGAESRRALGRQSEAFNPLQAAITQAQEVAIRAEKNAVGQAAFELAKAYPSPAMWSVKQVKMKQVFNRTTGLVELRPEDPKTMFLDPNEMAVKVSGQEYRIMFHDPRLARSLGAVGADQMNGVVRILSILSRFFSMTRTMLNPEFMVTNAFRDFQTAQFGIQAFGINPKTKQDDRAAIALAMSKNWRKAFAGVYRGLGNKTNTTWSQYFREFQKAGANISFWMLDQPEAAVGDMEKRIDLARGSRAARMLKHMRPSAFFNMRDNPALAFIERTNLAVDNAIRLAAFIKARELGWEVQDAAFLAKELTVNFNRRGETTSSVNALYPFFNAAIQGSMRIGKALTSKRVAILALMSVAAGTVLDLTNAALSDLDDDDELFYDKIPEYRSERNLHLVLWGTGDNPAAIPMPYGYNLFPYAGQQIGKVMRGIKTPEEAFGDVMVAAFGAFSPVNGGSPTTTVAPFIADPFIELAENKNFAGNTIYPAFPGTGSPDSQIFYPSATAASQYVAETLNELTGGDFRQSGYLDFSPETLDHLSQFVGGSASAFWGRSADILGKVLSGDLEGIEQRDVPFVRTITSPIGEYVNRDRYRQFSLQVKDAAADAKAYAARNMPTPPDVAAKAALYEAYLAAERELDGKGEWNPTKEGALTPREDNAVWLSFSKQYLKATRPKAIP